MDLGTIIGIGAGGVLIVMSLPAGVTRRRSDRWDAEDTEDLQKCRSCAPSGRPGAHP